MSALEIIGVVVMTTIEAIVIICKTSMFLEHRLPKAVSVMILTVFAVSFNAVNNIGTVSENADMVLYAVALQTILTPIVYSLCCCSWLTTVAEMYVYNIIFLTLPGAVISMFLPAEYFESVTSSYQSLAVNAAVFAMLNLLTIIAYKHRWLKSINAKVCIAVYIVTFYLVRVAANFISPALMDLLSNRVVMVVMAAFCVVSMMSALVFPELMFKRQQNEEAASRAELNRFICRHIAEQNTALRAFRHDLANHLQVADSYDANDIRAHRDRVAEIIDSYSAPRVTADTEVNAILDQAGQLMLSSGIEFSVNWVNPPSEFTAEQRDNLLCQLVEMYCDAKNRNTKTEITLTADAHNIDLRQSSEQNGVQQ